MCFTCILTVSCLHGSLRVGLADSVRDRAAEWTAGAFWNYDVRYGGSGPFADRTAAYTGFLDLNSTRHELNAVPTGRKPSVTADGVVAWAGFNSTQDFVKSAVPAVVGLLSKGVPTLVFTGQYDECMNVLSTAKWMATVRSWQHGGATVAMADFLGLPRTAVVMDGQTVGFARTRAGLSQFIVLRSGHMCTLEQPNVTRGMFMNFASEALSEAQKMADRLKRPKRTPHEDHP